MIRVLISEIHRILSARNLLLATIVGALWYLGLCWPQIEYLDDNEPNIHRVALDLTTRYGPTLEPDEFIGVQADLVRLTAEADSLVAAQPDLAAAGLHTFADVHSRGDLDTATSGLIWQVLLDDDGVGWRVQAYQGVVASYHDAETTLYANWSEPTVPVAQRIDKIIDAREWRSIQSAALLEQGGTYLEKVAILVVVVVLLLVGPLVTGDRATRVRALQATTRTGRRTLAIQLAATLLVSALTAIAVGILSGLALARFGLFSFWNNPIQSFLVGPSLYLWNLPLSGYAAVWLGLLALVGILAGTLGFAASRFSDGYTRLGLILTVTSILLGLTLTTLLQAAFTFHAPLTVFDTTPGAGIWTTLALTCISLLAAVSITIAERGIDIQ